MAVGHAMAHTVGYIPLTMEVCVQTQTTPCGIDGGQSEAETGSSLSTLVFPCLYPSIFAPYPFIRLQKMSCNVSS